MNVQISPDPLSSTLTSAGVAAGAIAGVAVATVTGAGIAWAANEASLRLKEASTTTKIAVGVLTAVGVVGVATGVAYAKGLGPFAMGKELEASSPVMRIAV
jgi:uncharacterized membrane protein (DUF441 family)